MRPRDAAGTPGTEDIQDTTELIKGCVQQTQGALRLRKKMLQRTTPRTGLSELRSYMAPRTGWASQLSAGVLGDRGLCTGPDAPPQPHPHTPGLGTAERGHALWHSLTPWHSRAGRQRPTRDPPRQKGRHEGTGLWGQTQAAPPPRGPSDNEVSLPGLGGQGCSTGGAQRTYRAWNTPDFF